MIQTLFVAALTMLPAFGYVGASTSNLNDNPSTEMVLNLAEMLSGEEAQGGADDASSARLFLWDMQRPGVLSSCVFLRMDEAVESATLDRDTAVLFLADLVDGTDSLTSCDAAEVAKAEAQLRALGLELPAANALTTQGTFDAEGLLSEAKDQRSRLKNAFERNNR